MRVRSLANALFRRFVLAFVLFSVVVVLGRALLDYQASRPRTLAVLSQLADTFAPGAASAIWDFQGELLQAIARGIGNNPQVQSVVISDHRGKVWAHWQVSAAVPSATAQSVTRKLLRTAANGQTQTLGSLLITANEQPLSSLFTQSLLRWWLPIVLLLLLLLALLWVLIQRLVVRPLSRFSQQLEQLAADPGAPSMQLEPAAVREIASLQNSFGQLMQQVARSHEQVSRHNTELGLRVAERTAQLSEQAEHTAAILDHIVDAVLSIDEHGVMRSLNPAAVQIFGYPARRAIGQNISLLLPSLFVPSLVAPAQASAALTPLAELLANAGESEGRRQDGSCFPVELAVSAITRQGQPMIVLMLRDITERKRIERMKNEFVSTVSHELRTPLTSISGALGLLAGGALGELPGAASGMLDVALRNSKMLALLINDLLDMDKLVAGKMRFDLQPYALAPLIEEALQANRQYGLERAVQVDWVVPEQPLWACVDKQRLQQALNNFLSNALKFSPPQGCVEVRLTPLGERLRISVRDHGPGISEAFRAHIFQKFSQADGTDTRQQGGTGLGLAITRELLEHMGGTVGFDSIPGQGATFWLELARLDEPLS